MTVQDTVASVNDSVRCVTTVTADQVCSSLEMCFSPPTHTDRENIFRKHIYLQVSLDCLSPPGSLFAALCFPL